MEKSKKKKGISLSHHLTRKSSANCEQQAKQDRNIGVRLTITSNSTPKQVNTSLRKANRQSNNSTTEMSHANHKHTRFSSNSFHGSSYPLLDLCEDSNKATKCAPQNILKVVQLPSEELVNPLKAARFVKVQRKNYLMNQQNSENRNRENVQAFFGEEFEKLKEKRQGKLEMENLFEEYHMIGVSATSPQDLKGEEKPVRAVPELKTRQPTTKRRSSNSSEDLLALQRMEGRFLKILNSCEKRFT